MQKVLPQDAALVDYFEYSYFDAKAGRSFPRWGAVLWRTGKPLKLALLPSMAPSVDSWIGHLVEAMRVPGPQPKSNDGTMEIYLKEFYKTFVAPLEDGLGDVRTLIVSPDGPLCFMPFAALMDSEGRFLCERFNLRQVNSARDVLVKDAPGKRPDEMRFVLFGGMKYDLDKIAEQAVPVSAEMKAFSGEMQQDKHGAITLLPGSKREVQSLAKEAEAVGWKVAVHTDEKASEAELRKVQRPDVLHLSTHGYFMKRQFSRPAENAMSLQNVDGSFQRIRSAFDPMNRSGLILAGAENTIKQWAAGKTFRADNDGFFTASEACNLDLNGTWLVTLNACETGAGDVQAGEGVLGLRRAFFYAGARNVMMSLWPVYDELSARFMTDFYKRAFATGQLGTSLTDTQRDWMLRLRKEIGLGNAVKLAAVFVLVGNG